MAARAQLFLHLFFASLALAGLLAPTAQAVTYSAGPFSYTIPVSGSTAVQAAPGAAFAASLAVLGQPSAAAATGAGGLGGILGMGYEGVVRVYDSSGNLKAEALLGPGVSDWRQTVTETTTVVETTTSVITTTITTTISGTPTVITQVQTVTLTQEGGEGGGISLAAAAGAALLGLILMGFALGVMGQGRR